jgi:hypothetical protein
MRIKHLVIFELCTNKLSWLLPLTLSGPSWLNHSNSSQYHGLPPLTIGTGVCLYSGQSYFTYSRRKVVKADVSCSALRPAKLSHSLFPLSQVENSPLTDSFNRSTEDCCNKHRKILNYAQNYNQKSSSHFAYFAQIIRDINLSSIGALSTLPFGLETLFYSGSKWTADEAFDKASHLFISVHSIFWCT